jgi:hypothetical protein
VNDLIELMTGIIFSPRETFQDLKQHKVVVPATILYLIAGLPFILVSQALNPEAQVSLTAPVVAQSLLINIFTLFIVAGLIYLSAKILGGEGDYLQMVQAVGFASLPRILLAIFLPFVYTMGARIEVIFGYANIAVSFWCFVLGVLAISETHEFTVGRAVGTLFVMLGLLIVLAIIVTYIVAIFFKGALPELPQV